MPRLPAITRNARRIIDDRQALTHESIEESRFSYVWTANDGQRGAHDSPVGEKIPVVRQNVDRSARNNRRQ